MPGSPLDQWMAMAELYRMMMGTPGGPGAPADSTQGKVEVGKLKGHPAWVPALQQEGLGDKLSPSPRVCKDPAGADARATRLRPGLLDPTVFSSGSHTPLHIPDSREGEAYGVRSEKLLEEGLPKETQVSGSSSELTSQVTVTYIAPQCLSPFAGVSGR